MRDLDAPLAARVYSTLLLAYPAAFRQRFADGMRHAFLEDYAAARARGAAASLRLWVTTVLQAVVFGSVQRCHRLGPGGKSSPGTTGASMGSIGIEIRDAVRALRATPGLTVVAILSLALGIGANTALFSILNTLVLRTLPVHDPQRLVVLDNGSWTNPLWEAIRAHEGEFSDGAFAWSQERFDLAPGGLSEFADGAFVSGGMFEVLGTRPALGRLLTPADDVRGRGEPIAVITHEFWQRRFAGAPDIVGRTLNVQRVPVTIIGVTPAGFFGPDVGRSSDVMMPLASEPLIRGRATRLDARSTWWLNIMARVKPGDTAESAALSLQRFHATIRDVTLPPGWRQSDLDRFVAEPFSFSPAATGRSSLRTQFQQPLTVILAVVGIVLLVACANLANLMIARATARRQELSLRLALGASRLRLARQLLLESVLLAGGGAVLGLAVAHWGSRLLVGQLAPAGNPVFLDLQLDWRVLGFTAGTAFATALLFGLAPSLGVLRVSPNEALADHGRRVAGDRRIGVRNALVVAQVALSLVLLVAAVLFGRTLVSLTTRPLGFDPDPVLVANVSALRSQVPPEQRLALFERLVAEVGSVPGVHTAAASQFTPLGGGSWNGEIEIPGGPDLPATERVPMMNAVTPGWFASYAMPIRAGRDISASDRPGAPDVAVVNTAFARRYFPNRSPLAGRVIVLRGPRDAFPVDIVGMVDDAVYRSLRAEAPATMYFSFAQQAPASSVTISVRSAGVSPDALTRPIADALVRVDRDLSLTLRPMAVQLGRSLTQERLVAMLAGFFGVLALVLSALGLYGVTSFAVNRRRSEIGIRLALGAHPATVVRLVLGRVAWMIAIGTVIGIGVSLWAAKFVETLVYGLDARDPTTLVIAGATLTFVGLAAAWRPARHASRIDPALTLRLE